MASSAECQPCPYPSQSRSHHSALTAQELDTLDFPNRLQ